MAEAGRGPRACACTATQCRRWEKKLPARIGADREPSRSHEDRQWLGATALMDLEDAKLRLRTRSLTQLCKNDRERALAIYGFVKRIPFARPIKFRLRTPRAVLDAGRGDALDKVGLLVAMMRIARIPARIRFMEMQGEILRGLISQMSAAARPVAEMRIAGRWLATDTYIFDAAYMAAARHRLMELGWDCGWGIRRDGASIWDGVEDAFLAGRDGLVEDTSGVYEDPLAFIEGDLFRATHPPMARTLHWNILAPVMSKRIRGLREEASPGTPAALRKLS
jgi:hypothetical protein